MEATPVTDNNNGNSLQLNIATQAEQASESPAPSSASTPGSSSRPCVYFAQGTCRFGAQCRFSHTTQLPSPVQSRSPSMPSPTYLPPSPMQQPPPPLAFINVPPNHPLFAIDVECVATAVQHNARSVAQVAVVDEWSRPVFNVYIKQEQPVLSYITELTGLTKDILDECGVPLAEALAGLRERLPSNSILIGQNILKDIQWLQLTEGVDYAALIDIAGLLRVWNPMRQEYTSFSQDHCAKVWMGLEKRPHHNALDDASIAMSLFNTYRMVQTNQGALMHMQMMTLNAPRIPGFSSTHPVVDGCCMGNRKKCSCGAAFF